MTDGKLKWFLRTPTLRQEIVQLVVMGGAMFLSTYTLYINVFSHIWAEPPRGISYHLVFGLINLFQWPKDPVFVLPTGLLIGLVLLIVADNYKRTYGVMLLGVFILGGYVLASLGVFIPEVDLLANLHVLLFGMLVGVVVGTVRWDGWVPDPDSVEIPLQLSGTLQGKREYPHALPRLLALLAALVVYTVLERWLVYTSPIVVQPGGLAVATPKLMGFHWVNFVGNVSMGLLFLASLYYVREYSKDQTTIVVGPTGSGKTTMMAGLSYTLSWQGKVSENNEPVDMLERRFVEGGFEAIPSTQRERVVPLELTFRHGYLFPKKVTIRTIDYAGELIDRLEPRDPDEVVTADADEAFSIAEYLCWQQDRDADADFQFFNSDPGGTSPTEFDGWPRDIESMDAPEQAIEVVNDMLYHSDTIGLVMPLDKFGEHLMERGTAPKYARLDEEGDLDVGARPVKVDREQFLRTYRNLYDAYGEDSSVFYIITLADLALRDYGEPKAHFAENWADFTDHIVESFIPSSDAYFLQGIFPNRTKSQRGDGGAASYDPTSVVPVHFDIQAEEADDDDDREYDGVLRDSGHPVLRGTRWLSERLGRTKGLKIWG